MYRFVSLIILVFLAGGLVAGCAAPTPVTVEKAVPQTVVVEKPVQVEKKVVETVVVEKSKEVVVTATPAPLPTPVDTSKVTHGGSLTIASVAADVPGMDPPVTWDAASWTCMNMVMSGLYRFKRDSSDVEPELAADNPKVSKDGLVYTIPIRKDVKFSNGREVKAADVKYTLDRMLAKDTAGWGVVYYMAIAGAADFNSGKASELTGIKVLDDYTVEITLNEPSPYFLQLLAMPWTLVIPKEQVEAFPKDFAHHPLGAGPYLLKEWVAGQKLTFTRNPNYWRKDEPFVDNVTYLLGVDTQTALLRVQKGEVDLIGDPMDATEYLRIKNDARTASLAREDMDIRTTYLTMNTKNKVLSNLKVRQAIAYAIDKERLAKSYGGLAVPAKGLLPAGSAEYWRDIPSYAYDPKKAKALLAEAGYPDGVKIDLVSVNEPGQTKFTQLVAQDLNDAGFKTDLHVLARAAKFEADANADNVAISFNSWSYELPDPSYILDGMLASAALYPGSCCNQAYYTTKELDDQLKAARTEMDPKKRIELYHQIDKLAVYDQVLYVPLFHPKAYTVVSPRVGGYNIPKVMAWTTLQIYRYWDATAAK